MKIKRLIAAALSVVMVGSTTTVVAFAEETTPAKTYNYVALGDSIASGYGLEGDTELGIQRALILSEDLIENPVEEAYATVFSGYLEELGATYGYSTSLANLSATAYRAEDIVKVIQEADSQGEVAVWIMDTFVAPGTSQALLGYHDMYDKYLPEADMVSIQLGGNDVIMGMLFPMIQSGNTVMGAMAVSMALVLFGKDVKTAIGGGLQYLMKFKDNLKMKDFVDTAKYLVNAVKNAGSYVDNASANVANVVDAVKAVNSNAEIALIGMFNPFGNSLYYQGKVRDLCTVMQVIFARAVKEVFGFEIDTDYPELVPPEEAEESVEEIKGVAIELDIIIMSRDYIRELRKKQMQALLNIITEEISYPLQYLLLGKPCNPMITKLNAQLADIAEEKGCTFVDVYFISNECNLDPHPDAAGHKEIADLLWEAMQPTIEAEMAGLRMVGDANADGVVDIQDATLLASYLAEFTTEDGAALLDMTDANTFLRCDVNGDNVIDVRDLSQIQRMIAEMAV